MNGNWIDHDGKGMPKTLNQGDKFYKRYRDGVEVRGVYYEGDLTWDWRAGDPMNDVIAYKVVS